MAAGVRVVIGELNKFATRKVKELTLAITANLIEDNPLDTGWSRNNWVPRIGKPFEGVVGTRDAVSGTQQAMGQASVAGSYKIEDGEIFISNSVPYVPILNEKHKTAAGFIQGAIEKGIGEVK